MNASPSLSYRHALFPDTLTKLSDEDICNFAFVLLDKMKNIIHEAVLENISKKNDFINDFINDIAKKICGTEDSEKIEIFKGIINTILNHEKYKSWNNPKALEFSFLIKYCSSSAYYRLYELLGEKLPPPPSIETYFKDETNKREKLLINAKDVNKLLNQYIIDNKTIISELIVKYNKTFNTKITLDKFKIQICLSSDAASLTPFTNKKSGNDSNKTLDNSKSKENHDKKNYIQEFSKR